MKHWRRRIRAATGIGLTWSAMSGLLPSGSFVVTLRGETVGGEAQVFGLVPAMASAVCAAGLLANARRSERRELPGPSGDPTEAALSEDEKRDLLGRGD